MLLVVVVVVSLPLEYTTSSIVYIYIVCIEHYIYVTLH
jgi:hypothetical protein